MPTLAVAPAPAVDRWAAIDTSCEPPARSTYLERQATSAHQPPDPLRSEPPVLAALRDAPPSSLEGRWYDRIRRCGETPLVAEDEAGLPVLITARCNHRLCPTCNRCRSARVSATIAKTVGTWNAVRFLTLTLAPTNAPLREQINRCLRSFRELRRTKFWRANVRRGFWCLEITCRQDGLPWHVHLHLLLDGKYVPQPLIKEAWRRITGDSYIVDIRFVHDRRSAARYLAKYVQKQTDFNSWPPSRIREYARGVYNVRSFGTFGSQHASTADRELRELRPKIRRCVISLRKLFDLARRGDINAVRAVGLARGFGGCWRRFLGGSDGPADERPPPASSYEEFLELCTQLDSSP